MDAIGNTQPVILPRQTVAVPVSQGAPSITLPDPSAHQPVLPDVSIDAQSAERAHRQTVERLAGDIANTHILGDQKFTMYKDAGGQLITRFRGRDGKVTYIPEPSLFKMSGSSAAAAPSLLKITA